MLKLLVLLILLAATACGPQVVATPAASTKTAPERGGTLVFPGAHG